jgi:hypothetical protein
VKHARGTAGVAAGDAGIWLSGHLEHGGGTLLEDYRPRREGLKRKRFAYGGRLPPGATAAVLIDDAGTEHEATVAGGAWVSVIDGDSLLGEHAVRFTDARGELVAPPLPQAWSREPVDDATEDCPACGGRAWDVVTATDGSRGWTVDQYGNEEPGRVVVCRRCGHEVQMGALVRWGPEDSEDTLSDPAVALTRWLAPPAT